MKKIKLTERDLTRIVKRILKEQYDEDTEIDLWTNSGIPTEVPIKTQIKEIFSSLLSKYGINKLCDSKANEGFPSDNNVMKLQTLLNQLREMSRSFGEKYEEFTEDGTFGFEEQKLFCVGSRKPLINYVDLAQCLKKENFQINDSSNYKFDAALQLPIGVAIEVLSSPKGGSSITVRKIKKIGSMLKSTPKKEFDFRGMTCNTLHQTIKNMISNQDYIG